MAAGSAAAQPGWRSVTAPGGGFTAVSAVGRWELVGGQRADAVPLRPQRMEVDSLDHRRVACRSQPRLGKRRLGGGQQGDDHVRAALHGQRLARVGDSAARRAAATAVDARSPIDAWAVGSAGTATLAEHWDGTNWSVVPTPALPGPAVLRGVAIAATSDVWAVGAYTDPNAFDHSRIPLIEHWDGSTRTSVRPTSRVATATVPGLLPALRRRRRGACLSGRRPAGLSPRIPRS